MPPALGSDSSDSSEGFRGDLSDDAARIGATIAVVALGGIALWAMSRSK